MTFSPCPRTTMFLMASDFLEARMGGARCVKDHGRAPRGERLEQA